MNFSNTDHLGIVGIFRIIMEKFKNGRWSSLTDIPVSGRNTALAQGTNNYDNNSCADGQKCYQCGGNKLCPDCP